jgi:hypothetical protein
VPKLIYFFCSGKRERGKEGKRLRKKKNKRNSRGNQEF